MLDNETLSVSQEAKDAQIALASMFGATFKTKSGKKVLEHLTERFVDVPIAVKGDDLLNVGLRQGQATLVRYIINQIEQAKGL